MRVLFSFIILGWLFTLPSSAQSFDIEPDSTLHVYPPMNEYSVHSITFPALTNDSLLMHWRLAEDNMIAGWDYALCDLGECYSAIPTNATMDTAFGEEIAYLEITFNPNDVQGIGNLIFYVNDVNYPDIKKRIEFIFEVGTSANQKITDIDLNVFPNPSNGIIHFDSQLIPLKDIKVYNLHGQLCYQQSEAYSTLDIQHLKSGTYILKAKHSGSHIQKKITINY